ncbi:MAG TPA: hypothetical protein PK367_03565 [Candidatus Paceibacterota bacterium]|nr:hypothetical protein [Candidatus Paceibacterota bacterium]
MNKKILTIVIIWVVVLAGIAAGYYFFKNQKTNNPVLNSYYNDDYHYSIQIPSDWSENYIPYRIQKNDVVFRYIKDDKKTIDIFFIDVMPVEQWNAQKTQTSNTFNLITINGENAFVYRLASDNPCSVLGDIELQKCSKIVNQINNVVNTMTFN